MCNFLIKKNVKRILTGILTVIVVLMSVDLRNIISVQAATEYETLYLIDNTAEKWVKNDNAEIKAIDNSHGHTEYWMTKDDENVWSVLIPKDAYNITFNRYAEDKITQWNSWSAGGRDKNNAYYIDGSEYGHWEAREDGNSEECFHIGDIVYLSVEKFKCWNVDNAELYVCLSAIKEDYSNKDIPISNLTESGHIIKKCTKVDDYIYAYVISNEEEKTDCLSFWRGNSDTLWNNSVELKYSDYSNGLNRVNVTGWDNSGYIDSYFNSRVYIDSLVKLGYLTENEKEELMDVDGDGLDIDEEYLCGTSPSNSDSDYDQLSDYDEIYIYGTDPTRVDSDGDGMSDGTEIQIGLDPNNIDTNGDGIIDSEEITFQQVRNKSFNDISDNLIVPDIFIEGKGDYSLKINVEDISDNEMFKKDWIIGNVYNFKHDDNMVFNSSQLYFHIDKKELDSVNADELCIAYYNENTNGLEFVESTFDEENSTISASVEHYSIFFVVNIEKYIKELMVDSTGDVVIKGKADIAFVIDSTGSMRNVIEQVKNCVSKFAGELAENKVDVRIGLIEYKDIYEDYISSTKSYGWFNDIEEFKNQLNKLEASGGGDDPESLVDALNVMLLNLKFRSDVSKYTVVITDASYKNGIVNDSNYTLDEMTEELSKKGIITTVITNPIYAGDYENLVNKTGGKIEDITSDFSDNLRNVVTEIIDDIGEGCWIRLINGEIIKLEKNPNEGDRKIDSDGDGIPDLVELRNKVHMDFSFIPKKYRDKYNLCNYIECWQFYSNPSKKDTDGDTLEDSIDVFPTQYQPMEFGLEVSSVYYLKLFNKTLREKDKSTANYEFARCIASISYGKTLKNVAMWGMVAGLYYSELVEGYMRNNGLDSNMAVSLYLDIDGEHVQALERNKVDFAHMMATIACNLYEGKGKELAALGGVSPALHGTVNDYSGYYGDVFGTLFALPSLNNDDYLADLDAVNILKKLQNNDIVEVCENYYQYIDEGKINRAYEFTKNIRSGSYVDGLNYLVIEANIYADNVKFDSEEVNKNARKTICKFILNLIMQNNELINYLG